MKTIQKRITNWTSEEDNWLKKNYLKNTLEECSNVLNRTKNAIVIRATRTLALKNNKYWTTEELDFLIENYPHSTIIDLQKNIKKSKKSIIGKANKLGLKMNKYLLSVKNRKDFFNQDFFKEIDSFEKAYWLGWIWSDGNITRNGCLRFSLQKRDKQVLYEFKKDLQSTRKIDFFENKGFNYVRFAVNSPKLINDLLKFNVAFNKTYSQSIPNIPKEFIDGFLLGLFEGDGSVGIYNGYLKMSFTGTTSTMFFVKKCIEEILNKKIINPYETGDSILFARLNINNQNDIYELYKYLYRRAKFFLLRKEKIMRVSVSFNKKRKKKSSKYNGVDKLQGRFCARIGYDRNKEFLGYFDNETDAAKAYDKRLKEINGNLNKLNFQ
jgi:hypothetical protein